MSECSVIHTRSAAAQGGLLETCPRVRTASPRRPWAGRPSMGGGGSNPRAS